MPSPDATTDIRYLLPEGWRGTHVRMDDGKSRLEIETPFGYFRRFFANPIDPSEIEATVAAAVVALA